MEVIKKIVNLIGKCNVCLKCTGIGETTELKAQTILVLYLFKGEVNNFFWENCLSKLVIVAGRIKSG